MLNSRCRWACRCLFTQRRSRVFAHRTRMTVYSPRICINVTVSRFYIRLYMGVFWINVETFPCCSADNWNCLSQASVHSLVYFFLLFLSLWGFVKWVTIILVFCFSSWTFILSELPETQLIARYYKNNPATPWGEPVDFPPQPNTTTFQTRCGMFFYFY